MCGSGGQAMTPLSRKFHDFWFPEAPASRLALLRILVGVFCLGYLWVFRLSMYTTMAGTDPALFEPVGLAAALPEPLPPWVFHLCVIGTLVANVLFTIGWQHRFTGPAFGLLLLWMLCYRNSWSMIYHSDNLLVFFALILGFSPAAEALSMDALSRSAPGRLPAGAATTLPAEGHWMFGWPIRLMAIVGVLTYFLCGIAKVAGPLGWSWPLGEPLRGQFAVDGLRKELLGPGLAPPLLFQLYDHLWVFTVLGMVTMVVELGAPLALFHGRLGRIWALTAWLMHWGIFFLMDI